MRKVDLQAFTYVLILSETHLYNYILAFLPHFAITQGLIDMTERSSEGILLEEEQKLPPIWNTAN